MYNKQKEQLKDIIIFKYSDWLVCLVDTFKNILHVGSSKMSKLHEYLLGQNGEQEMVFYK